MKSIVVCLFCGKLLRYKSIILSVDEQIMALKIRVAVTDFSSSDAVFVNFFGGVAVFRPPPPMSFGAVLSALLGPQGRI